MLKSMADKKLFIFFVKRYSVADSPYSIPSNSNLEALNLLIKGILKEDKSVEEDEILDELVEFDFYINSKPIVTTLDEFVELNDEVKVVRLCLEQTNSIFLFQIKFFLYPVKGISYRN